MTPSMLSAGGPVTVKPIKFYSSSEEFADVTKSSYLVPLQVVYESYGIVITGTGSSVSANLFSYDSHMTLDVCITATTTTATISGCAGESSAFRSGAPCPHCEVRATHSTSL